MMRWHRRPPAAFAIGLYPAFLACTWPSLGTVRGSSWRVPSVRESWLGPAIWGFYSALVLLAIAVLCWWGRVGLTRRGRSGRWRLLLYQLATGTVFLLVGINMSSGPRSRRSSSSVAVADRLQRGRLLPRDRPRGASPLGWRRAIIGSAVLFGATHAVNLVVGANLPFTVMQVAATTAGGVAFATIRIRGGSLWPPIALHTGLTSSPSARSPTALSTARWSCRCCSPGPA